MFIRSWSCLSLCCYFYGIFYSFSLTSGPLALGFSSPSFWRPDRWRWDFLVLLLGVRIVGGAGRCCRRCPTLHGLSSTIHQRAEAGLEPSVRIPLPLNITNMFTRTTLVCGFAGLLYCLILWMKDLNLLWHNIKQVELQATITVPRRQEVFYSYVCSKLS
jgi:hypothetical protein